MNHIYNVTANDPSLHLSISIIVYIFSKSQNKLCNYLRNSMTRQHLNHRIHLEKTDALDINCIAKEFAQENVSSFFLDHIKVYLHAYNEL